MCRPHPLDPCADFQFARYLPMFDPDHFTDVAFFRELWRIGYRQVLLGGTGTAGLGALVEAIKTETSLQVVLYPGGPAAVAEADLVVLPDVMNSNSHYARPFGSGSVATAAAIAQRGLPFLAVAYFIMGNSTAGWFYDAFRLPSDKVLIAYARYARMLGYRYVALDYEDPATAISPRLIAALAEIEGLRVIVSDEFTPERGLEALRLGAETIITPSNVYEDAPDPLGLAATMHATLLSPAVRARGAATFTPGVGAEALVRGRGRADLRASHCGSAHTPTSS
jgi:heptaprenylglyceryl phosphate synthase